MARHLPRLTDGLERALDGGLVGRRALGLLQPRSPAISMTNAMQQTMGTRAHQVPRPGQGCPVRLGSPRPAGLPSGAERKPTARVLQAAAARASAGPDRGDSRRLFALSARYKRASTFIAPKLWNWAGSGIRSGPVSHARGGAPWCCGRRPERAPRRPAGLQRPGL